MRRVILLLGGLSGAIAARPADAQDRVVVNGERVTQEQYARELGRLSLPLTVPVPDGDYWYDRVSGLWGVRGGPTLGQLPPDLTLGGELLADASGRGSGIFFNGRELHPAEVVYLQRLFGYALPGRYWLNALGIGGVEGGRVQPARPLREHRERRQLLLLHAPRRIERHDRVLSIGSAGRLHHGVQRRSSCRRAAPSGLRRR